jgi:hypothetical protein
MKYPSLYLNEPKREGWLHGFFFYWRNFAQKRNSEKSDFGGFQSPEVRKFRKKKKEEYLPDSYIV